MIKSLLLILVLFSQQLSAMVVDEDTPISGILKLKRMRSLESILTKNFKIPKKFLEGENDVRPSIKEQNPHIKNWKKIPKNSKIYLEFPEDLRENFFHRISSKPVYNRVGQMENLPKNTFKKMDYSAQGKRRNENC